MAFQMSEFVFSLSVCRSKPSCLLVPVSAQKRGVSDSKAAVLCGRSLDIAGRYEVPAKLFTEWVFEAGRSK
jgi:hypothetical protein